MPGPVATPATVSTPAAASTAPQSTPTPTQPPTPGKTDVAAPPEVRVKLKVDGEEREYTQAEIQKLTGKAAYADKVISQTKEEAKRMAAEREKLLAERALWDDESKLEAELMKRGVLDKLARKYLAAKVAEHEMSPEQREAAAAKAEADRLKKELESRDAETQKAKQTQAQQVLQQRLEASLSEAAERAGFPKTADAFDMLYQSLREWVRLGLPWNPDQLVADAQERIEASFDSLRQRATKSLKGKALVEKLGPDVVKEVLRYKMEELRGGGARAAPPPAQPPRPKEQPQYLSPADLQEKYRGGGR